MFLTALISAIFGAIALPVVKKTNFYRRTQLGWKERHEGLTADELIERSFMRRVKG